MSKYLTLITEDLRSNSLALGNESIFRVLSSNSKTVTTDNIQVISEESNKFRALRCSELYNKLKSRGWNNYGIKYVSSLKSDNHKIKSFLDLSDKYTNDGIPIQDTATSNGLSVDLDNTVLKEKEDIIDNIYNNIYHNMNGTSDIYLPKSSNNSYDLIEGTFTVDLIRMDSDTYTNNLSLVELIKHAVNLNLIIKIDLSIQYSMFGNIYSKDISFNAFSYKDSKLEMQDFINEVDNNVEIDYINGIIKLLPMSDDVDEFIISNCTITYGKF